MNIFSRLGKAPRYPTPGRPSTLWLTHSKPSSNMEAQGGGQENGHMLSNPQILHWGEREAADRDQQSPRQIYRHHPLQEMTKAEHSLYFQRQKQDNNKRERFLCTSSVLGTCSLLHSILTITFWGTNIPIFEIMESEAQIKGYSSPIKKNWYNTAVRNSCTICPMFTCARNLTGLRAPSVPLTIPPSCPSASPLLSWSSFSFHHPPHPAFFSVFLSSFHMRENTWPLTLHLVYFS